MKYILIILVSIVSHTSFASYHDNEGSAGSSGGGGYGSDSNALAIVGVGLIAYFVLRENDDEETAESNLKFNLSSEESKYEIDFRKSEFHSLNENYFKTEVPVNKFQINLRYKLN